jgi:glucose-6-phosphate isomerase
LQAVGWWYDHLLVETLGQRGRGATSLTVLGTRDLPLGARQHPEGRADKIYTNLSVDRWRWDPLPIGWRADDTDGWNERAEQTLPELMDAAARGAREACRAAGRPTAELRLPQVDEFYLGQLLQMLMLATVVEGRLIGVNPCGQPGLRAYQGPLNKIAGTAASGPAIR